MRVLVTGGAGFVGSVVAERLLTEGYDVTVLDNLRQGHRVAVPAGAGFALADICDLAALRKVFQNENFDAVMHMAADTVVERSMKDPHSCFHTNIVGGINLLDTMLKHQVSRLIFSSSASVYGDPKSTPIEEEHPKQPTNAYGDSKAMFEKIMSWYGSSYALKYVSLRYFNAAGATRDRGEDHNPETHLIPNVLKAALHHSAVRVFGLDYPTPDGSCIRDYVHVADIARAHVLALRRLDTLPRAAYNLGNSRGYSVLEVIQAAARITGVNIDSDPQPRRAGDPAVLVASSYLAKRDLGWEPDLPQLEDMIASAWEWLLRNRQGYSDASPGTLRTSSETHRLET